MNSDPGSVRSNRRLAAAAAASLLIHLSIARGIMLTEPSRDRLVEVNLVALPAAPQRSVGHVPAATAAPAAAAASVLTLPESRIVPPSDAPESEPPEKAKFLSDKNTKTAVEMVKRGSGPAGGTTKSVSRRASSLLAPAPPLPAQDARTAKSGVSTAARLRLGQDEIEQRLAILGPEGRKAAERSKKQEEAKKLDSSRLNRMEHYEPFRKGSTGSLFPGDGGAPEYLPSIPDGDITLLNAKADHHAVFVRRVALQVFGALRQRSWAQATLPSLRGAKDFATVHAVMSADGKLLSAAVEGSSGSSVFDRIAVDAARQGAWDQNPPPGAAAGDGKIHFVFKAKTWARSGGEGYREMRWLLLGTGLL